MRLIDADVLKENMFFHEIDNVSYAEEKDIDNTPTVDAVQVVRCKDCKWHLNNTHTCTMFYFCGSYTRDDFYCADGKRSE